MDDRTNIRYLRRLNVIVVSTLVTATTMNSFAAGIVADGSAAKNQQPIITETANGVPQVNVQTPSSEGISRNRYTQFDVGQQGAILNNSAQHANSQLGGWVQGNSLLAGGTARIILNEVNSHNPSLLQGPLEIAGDKAQLVIANPAGISCDGCGFINAHRSTLTTGKALFNKGNLTGFDVEQGHISISGAGMDDRGSNYSDLIARTVSVNADIWANKLKISPGVNQVDANNQLEAIHIGEPDKPAFSIDLAALGGMYADTIKLIGTEHGVGVRHAGRLEAESLVLDTEGQLSLMQGSVIEAGKLEANMTDLTNNVGSEVTASNIQISSSDSVTNYGLLDAKQVMIKANNINNSATGAIYADTLVMESEDIRNQSELSASGVRQAPVIAARQSLKVSTESLFNDEGAVIYSTGDAIFGGQRGSELYLQGNMAELINQGGLIEAGGNLTMDVADLQNLNAELVTEWQTDSVERIIEVQPEGWSRKYDVSRFPKIHNHNVEKQPFIDENGKFVRDFEDYTYYDYYATTESTHLISSKPAQLIAGESLSIVGNVNNEDSQILAGGELTISGGSMTNHTTPGEQRVSYHGRRQFRDWEGNDEELDFYAWTAYSPAAKLTEFNLATTQVESRAGNMGGQSLYSSDQIPSLSGSWFQQTANPSENFFIETDARFIDYRDWLSSDYMLMQMAYSPEMMMKRLGDGFIEQRLVREQIAQLTGQPYLSGFADDEAQFMALMDAGVSFAEIQQLTPGVALSAEQVAMLTSDIVWLEQQKIAIANGETVTALVPRVYVKARAEDLIPGTGLLAGKKVDIQLENNIVNTGTIAGRELVNLNSDFVQHDGRLQGKQVQVNADLIAIKGGSIQVEESLNLNAQKDINISSATSDTRNKEARSRFSRTNIKRIAGLYVTGDGGSLNIESGRNMVISAADIQQIGEAGKVSLAAAKALTLGTVRSAEANNSIHSAQDFNKHSEQIDIGTKISAKGDVSLEAGNKVALVGANINSQKGNIGMAAEQVHIKSGTASYLSDIATHTERDGTFSSKSKDQRDRFYESTAVASVLSGKTISVDADSDINISGSHLVADKELKLQAADNISVTSAEQRFEREQYINEEESGLLSGGGIGFTIGSQQLDVRDISKQTRHLSSEVASLEGNVSIDAGQNYRQQASNVMAVLGNIDITAEKVDIESATEINTREHTTEFSQSGLSISITNPVISAVQTADQMVEAARETSDPRMRALAAATIGLSAKNAYDSVMAGRGSNGANGAEKVGGINLAFSFGSSESSSQRREIIKEAHSSKLIAGGDLNIAVIGDGQHSDLTVIGSEIQAGESISLKADDALNLIAAKNTRDIRTKNESSSGSLGISIGTDGLLFTAGMSKGKGKENGQDRSWTETTIKAAEKVALESGSNTELKGATVSGKQVTVKVGNNLDIQSLQDFSRYDAEQKNVGGSISVGYGKVGGSFNLSASDIKSDYVSVIEQSGIQAGGNGFQVEVKGNTHLEGAVIASTQEAIEKQKNSLVTGSLTLADINNEAEYDAEAAAVTMAMGTQSGELQLTGSGIGRDNDSIDSVTVSAVSGSELQITDNVAQESRTGERASSTIIKLNRDVLVDEYGNVVNSQGTEIGNALSPIFDVEKVASEINTQVQITKAFGQQAYKAVSDYVDFQRGGLLEKLDSVQTENEKADIQKQLDELLFQERVINVLIGAVSGMGESAVTKESLSIAAAEMRRITIENSILFAGVIDGNTILTNMTGESLGVLGDGIKTGGTRIDLDLLCGPRNERCVTKDDGNGSMVIDLSDGKVQWNRDGANGQSLSEWLKSPDGKKMAGATGGVQGGKGTLFGIPYAPGSWQDKLIESFGGTHDFIGGQISSLYDEQGNARRDRTRTEKALHEVWSGLAIAPSAPFAMAALLPPEIWRGVGILLESAQ